jgi:hypothetical protein
MWRVATSDDDKAVVSMCIELNTEDPAPAPYSLSKCEACLQNCAEILIAAEPSCVISGQSATLC